MDATTALPAAAAAATLAPAAVELARRGRTRRDLRRAALCTDPGRILRGSTAHVALPPDLLPDHVYPDDIGVPFLAPRRPRGSDT